MIELRNVEKRIQGQRILGPLNLTLPDEGLFLLTGDNGSGKTTLLYLLALLDEDYYGKYLLDGTRTDLLSRREREKLRTKKISLLLPRGNLVDFLTVSENGRLFCPQRKEPEDLRLSGTLSGGEEIQVALRQELSLGKKILLLDEITSSLSDEHAGEVISALKEASRTRLVLLATHDPRVKGEGETLRLPSQRPPLFRLGSQP